MNLAELSPRTAAGEAQTLHLKHPATGVPLMDGDIPVTIDLLGVESEALQNEVKAIERRKLAGEEMSEEREGAEKIAALIVGWSGIGLHSEKSLKYSRENAIRLALDPEAYWILEQIGPFARNRRNFMKAVSS